MGSLESHDCIPAQLGQGQISDLSEALGHVEE